MKGCVTMFNPPWILVSEQDSSAPESSERVETSVTSTLFVPARTQSAGLIHKKYQGLLEMQWRYSDLGNVLVISLSTVPRVVDFRPHESFRKLDS